MDVLLELAGDSMMWGASGDGSEGCSCKTALSCQHPAAGEEGNLGQARLQGCVCSSLAVGQPRRVPGSCLGSPPGGEGEGIGIARAPHVLTAISQPCPAQ